MFELVEGDADMTGGSGSESATGGYLFEHGYPVDRTAQQARDEADVQRAVTAYRFWYPTVSMEGIFNGNREIGLADNEAVGIASTGPLQVGFTLNSDTPYGAAVLDLSAGPMVVDVPQGPFIGLVDDHHQRWITDLGIPGPDRGQGGTYVITPPGHRGELPPDAHVGRSASNKVLLAIRALPIGGDLTKALDALRAVRIHPLGSPDRTLEFVDTTEKPVDSTCLRWEDDIEFWRVLHGIVTAEPPVAEFLPMYGLLSTLGIEKGAAFAPDERMSAILARAARTGRDQMLVSAFASDREDRIAWPDRRWEWVGLVADNGDFATPAGIDLEARDRWFSQAIIASPAMFRRQVGGGSLYWLGVRDASGAFLDGGTSYTLEIPQPVPGTLFWSITIYDAQTRSQVQADRNSAALRSMFELNDVDQTGPLRLHLRPTAPRGAENRWLQTVPGRGWFAYLRIYGPEQAAFDGTWKPADFEKTG